MKTKKISLSLVLLTIFFLAASCAQTGAGFSSASPSSASPTASSPLATSTPTLSSSEEPQGYTETTQDAITKAVEMVSPAVVFIDTIYQPSTISFPEFFYPFFEEPQPQEGQGSGVIVDGKNGYIITNNHVVTNAADIKVTLPDGRTFTGTVMGTDSFSDIAVVKVDATNLPEAKLGDTSDLRIGSWAIAIGNPYGFENTVTVGVISAKSRTITNPDTGRPLQDLIQTDAAINPGNSGGALANIKGEVIGINTAIIPFAQGIGFAVDINTVKDVFHDLITYGSVNRPWIGITYTQVTDDIAEQLNLPDKAGVVVVEVIANSPAQKAGIQQYDVIKAIDGKPINKTNDLRETINSKKVGDSVTLTIWRQGNTLAVTCTLEKMPAELP